MAKSESLRSMCETVVNYEERAAQARRLMSLCTDRAALLILCRLVDYYDAMASLERQRESARGTAG